MCAAPPDFTPPTPTSAAGQNRDQRTILDLATRLHESADDAATGDHTYVRYRLRTATATATSPASGTTPASTIVTVDYEYWIGDDRSGIERITRYPAAAQDPEPGNVDGVTDARIYPAHRIFPRFPTPFIGKRTDVPPPAADPDHPSSSGTIRNAVAIVAAASQPCPYRVIMLHVLAVNGAVYQGPATDRAGRPGIAITADEPEHAMRDTLIIDADTGTVLAYEQQPTSGQPADHTARPARTELSMLFYANRRSVLPTASAPSPAA